MTHFNDYGFDPIVGTDIMNLLSLDDSITRVPRYFQQVKDIVSYFSNEPSYRSRILNILSGKQGNKLDILWTYVELQKEKARTIHKLEPTDFTKDVIEEIASGHITKPTRDILKEQITRHKELAKQQEQKETAERKAVAAIPTQKLDVYSNALEVLEGLEKELSHY